MTINYKAVTDINAIRDYIGDAAVVAYDFETAPANEYRDDPKAALDPAKSHICTMSLSVKEGTGIMIPVSHVKGENINRKEFFQFLKDFLTNRRIVKVAHNLAFEAMYAYKYGIVTQEPVYDTIAASQMSLKNEFDYRKLSDSGLKKLSEELCGEPLPSFETVTGGKYFDELDPQDPETIRYSCADADYALRLRKVFNDWFGVYLPAHRKIVEKIESPTAVYLGIMKFNGVPVDKQRMLERKAEAEAEAVQKRNEILAITGDIDIGSNCSTSEFKKYLFETLKLPVLRETEKGTPAIDNIAMIMLEEWCAKERPEISNLFRLILDYRKIKKITTTYIDGYSKYINEATGRIHPNFTALSTDTGRFACTSPNLQNMPRKGNDPVGVRNFMRAPEGQCFISCDYSQIELRVGAYYCRDKTMLDIYRRGGDIHAATTSVLYNIPYEQAVDKETPDYKERRTIAKNVNFGVFYGLYPRGLQQTLKYKAGINKSYEQCEEIINNLKAGYPQLEEWQQRTKEEAAIRMYSETCTGRRRYLPKIKSDDWSEKSYAERCSLNTPIQGTAADIIKLAMGRILKGLPERPWLKPVLQIHDELVFMVPNERVGEAAAYIKECMEPVPFPGFDVPLVAEAAAGQTFGALVELDTDEGYRSETAKHSLEYEYEPEAARRFPEHMYESETMADEIEEEFPPGEMPKIEEQDIRKQERENECPNKQETAHTEETTKVTEAETGIDAQMVLSSLFDASEKVCFRIFDDIKGGTFGGKKLEEERARFPAIKEFLYEQNALRRGISFVVNYGGHDDASITRINAQFVEMDNGSFEEQQKRIDAFPLAPSMIIQTKKSFHVYWFVDKTAEVGRFRDIQKKLVKQFDGDPACVNESRAMRLPGFNHCKQEPPVQVKCTCFHPERRYTQEKLLEVLPEADKSPIPKKNGEQKGLDVVMEKCCFLQHCRDDAATLSEPEWYAMITNLANFDGGSELIHELSAPYPGYNERETQQKINRCLDGGQNPITCKTICEKGYVCDKYEKQECPVRAPAAWCYQPLDTERLFEILDNLPVASDSLKNMLVLRSYIEKYLYNQDEVIADAIIKDEIQAKYRLSKDKITSLRNIYKEAKQIYQNAKKRRETRMEKGLPEWYEVTDKGYLKFLPGVLGDAMAATQKVFYSAAQHYIYGNGVYDVMPEMEAQRMIQEKMLPYERRMSQIKDAEMQWRLEIQRAIRETNENPYMINVKNGLYNVLENSLIPHTPDYYSTVQLNASYDMNADCPLFKKYLSDSMEGDMEQVMLLQEILGYLLVPINSAQKCFILVGEANSGKSVLLSVIQDILLGIKNVSNITWQSLNERFKPAEIFGKLANVFADLPDKNIEDNGMFKAIVGEDYITVEKKNKDPFSFQSTARLIFSCNNIPKNYGDRSEGFYRRLIIIRFNRSIPIEQRDPQLKSKLKEEADGIFLFALEGLRRLIANNFIFSETEKNKSEVQKYREESNSVLSFVNEYCEMDIAYAVGSSELYNAYKKYCEDEGLRPCSHKTFITQLTASNPQIKKGIDRTANRRILTGIRLGETLL